MTLPIHIVAPRAYQLPAATLPMNMGREVRVRDNEPGWRTVAHSNPRLVHLYSKPSLGTGYAMRNRCPGLAYRRERGWRPFGWGRGKRDRGLS